jgi:N-acyl homoserine lactone hydrolase
MMKHTCIWIILALVLFTACQPSGPTQSPYQLAAQPETISWNALPTAQIDSFRILNTGSVEVPRSGMLNTKKLPDDHDLSQRLWVDVYIFLFHHRTRGWFMIDTGLDSTFQEKGNITGLLAGKYIKDCRQAPGQNTADQLEKFGNPIEGIFFTHLHGDHTAGLPEIDRSIPKMVGGNEKHIHIPLLYQSDHLTNQDSLWYLDWEQSIKAPPFDQVLDIFGDQSLVAIATPGHSQGHTSYLLNTTKGRILLTGDASHTRYGFENGIEPGWTQDREAAVHSLEQLRQFHREHPDIQVVFGHQQ